MSGEVLLKPYGSRMDRFAHRPPEFDRRITVLEGAVRSSKTWGMIPKVQYLVRYPVGGVGLITGVSKQTIYNNVLSDLFNIIGSQNYTYNRQSGELTLFGRRCVVMGAKDEGSEKYVRGLTVGWAYGDELTLLPKSFVWMLLNRMSPDNARAYFTTNPDTPFHYVKKELIDSKILQDAGNIESIHFDLDDNPNISDAYKQYLHSLYSGVFEQRYIYGLWVVAEGAIYRDCWSPDLLYDDDSRPKGLLEKGTYAERWIGVDYGTDHPQVYLDIFDDSRVLWVEREYVWDSHATTFSYDAGRWLPADSHCMVTLQQKTDSQYADDLEIFLSAQFNYCSNRWMMGGPEAFHQTDAQVVLPPECASFEAELSQRGIWYCTADNAVLDGIRTVSSLMNRRMLRIHRENCPRLVERLQTYAWDSKAAKHGEEKPIKDKDDEPDALRYPVQTKIGKNAWRLGIQ